MKITKTILAIVLALFTLHAFADDADDALTYKLLHQQQLLSQQHAAQQQLAAQQIELMQQAKIAKLQLQLAQLGGGYQQPQQQVVQRYQAPVQSTPAPQQLAPIQQQQLAASTDVKGIDLTPAEAKQEQEEQEAVPPAPPTYSNGDALGLKPNEEAVADPKIIYMQPRPTAPAKVIRVMYGAPQYIQPQRVLGRDGRWYVVAPTSASQPHMVYQPQYRTITYQ